MARDHSKVAQKLVSVTHGVAAQGMGEGMAESCPATDFSSEKRQHNWELLLPPQDCLLFYLMGDSVTFFLVLNKVFCFCHILWLLEDDNNMTELGNVLPSGERVLGFILYAHNKEGAKSLKMARARIEHFAASLHLAGLIPSQQNFSHPGNVLLLYMAWDS